MMSLLDALSQFALSSWDLIKAIAILLGAAAPLLGWLAWWTFAVDWTTFREVVKLGGWVGVLLLGALSVIIWWCAEPSGAELLGIAMPSLIAKSILVATLILSGFACGVVQLQWKSWKSTT